jgi:hypothetical protein
MARSKPNKPLKSPHKQQIEEQNKQNKTYTTPSVTPHTTKTIKRKTGTEERSEKRDITQRKYIQNPENIPYYEGDSIHRRINRNDRNKEQFDESGDIAISSDDDFMQPSDEDPQGNVITDVFKMNDYHRTKKTQTSAQPEVKIVPRRLNRTKKDSVNKNTKLTT